MIGMLRDIGASQGAGDRAMMRGFAVIACLLSCAAALAGCDLSMTEQRKLATYAPSTLWADGTSARPLPDHVVAQGAVERTAAEKTPPPVTTALLARGRERFDIFCAPCHGLAGDGDGIIVAHGFPAPPSYHIDRLLAAPAQHFYDVITDGYGVDVLLRGSRRAARSLGDRRLYPRAAIVAPRNGRPNSRRVGERPMRLRILRWRCNAERRIRRRGLVNARADCYCLLQSEQSPRPVGWSGLYSG